MYARASNGKERVGRSHGHGAGVAGAGELLREGLEQPRGWTFAVLMHHLSRLASVVDGCNARRGRPCIMYVLPKSRRRRGLPVGPSGMPQPCRPPRSRQARPRRPSRRQRQLRTLLIGQGARRRTRESRAEGLSGSWRLSNAKHWGAFSWTVFRPQPGRAASADNATRR